ncbi:MAG: 50S ribosomal protein L11 methyltransferase [Oscillospiraceae bacterium]|nr:50S ribosomal protein L11 methyltransferase [Oscillospiraceae bacterium]
MDYAEIAVRVAARDCDTAAAIANMSVPYGIYIEDYSDMEAVLPTVGIVDYIDDALLAKDREHAVVHIYIPAGGDPAEALSFLEERLSAAGVPHTVETGSVSDEVFLNEWKKYYKPQHIGARLVVCPSWEHYTPQEGERVLSLDPAGAFGTGKHETTRLCLELLEGVVRGGERVLDMGTGSGILAIAALLLGAQSALGVDIEPGAARTARENAEKNGFGPGRFAALCGDVTADAGLRAQIGGGYDILTANIVADVLIAMAPLFREALRAGGALLASGVIDTREDEVRAALEAAGFAAADIRRDGGWSALLLHKQG